LVVALHLLGTFTAPGFDPTAVFPKAPRSAGIVAIRIYYEESDKQFRIQVHPYFEHKIGLKLQVYPKQIEIVYHELEAAKRASQAYVESNIRKVFGKHYPGKVEWADDETRLSKIEPWRCKQ
jgi:hypothetical protein